MNGEETKLIKETIQIEIRHLDEKMDAIALSQKEIFEKIEARIERQNNRFDDIITTQTDHKIRLESHSIGIGWLQWLFGGTVGLIALQIVLGLLGFKK